MAIFSFISCPIPVKIMVHFESTIFRVKEIPYPFVCIGKLIEIIRK